MATCSHRQFRGEERMTHDSPQGAVISLTLHDIMLTLRFCVADSLLNPHVRVLRAGVEISRQIAVPMIPKSKAVLPAVKNSWEAVANAVHGDQIVRAFREAPLTSLGTPPPTNTTTTHTCPPALCLCRCTVWISSSVTIMARRSLCWR